MNQAARKLNHKIRDFVKRYYWNELLKGGLLFLCIVVATFVSIAVLEYFSFLNSTVRFALLLFFIALTSLTTIIYIAIPIIKLLGLGKQLSTDEIAKIIGKHFPEIDDKLLNLFQLQQMQEGGKVSQTLLDAAIERKSETLTPFPFLKAIPVKKSVKFAKWAAVPVLIFIGIFVVKSEIITESTKRVVNYDTYYEKPAPYNFTITNSKLETYQNEDFTIAIKIEGEELPLELFIQLGNISYKCVKKANAHFEYTFTNVQKNTDFQLKTDEVMSKLYTLNVLPKPITISYVLTLDYPTYTKKITEVMDNNGDVTVPEGTAITWKVYTKNTEVVQFIKDTTVEKLTAKGDNFEYTLRARETFGYSLVNENKHLVSADTLTHAVHVIKDGYPEIVVQQQIDTVFADRMYFRGNIKDDYGFTALHFVYNKYDENGLPLAENQKLPIEMNMESTIQDFYFYFDAGTLGMEPGYKVEYYFAVADNDGVNGAKESKSKQETFTLKTEEQIEQELNEASKNSKSEMEALVDESAELIKNLEKLRQQLIQQQEPNWQDKKSLEALMNQYNELKQKIDAIKQTQELNQFKEEQYKDQSAEILKKQQELQRRMEDILSDEMKDMMQKMQEMMQEMNKDQMQDAMQKMKMSSEDINKSLDQQLQLYKQLEFEKRFEETLDKARSLAEEQRKLSKETQQKGASKEALQQKQNSLNQKFNELKDDVKALQNLNKQLEEPIKMSPFSQEQQQISEKMQEASEQLQKNNKNKASESQNEAADQMDELADKMEQEKNEEENEDIAEDIESLRQILDNLIQTSIKQEQVMGRLKGMGAKSPELNDAIQAQFNIQDYMRLIDDSLTTLARRQPSVQPFIQKEVTKVRDYLSSTQTHLSNRSMRNALSSQQFAFTSMNNLALMLAESLKEMNEKKKESDGKCNKKGGKGSSSKKSGSSKSKPQSARELQQQLNRQMEALQKSLEQGKQPEGQTPGMQPGMQQQMSEQFARMAAQQEAIRKMMQEYNDQLKSASGTGDKSIEQMMKEMEATERDLVNRVVNRQTINRQKNIETRLLQSEKAEMEREKEEKREAKEAMQKYHPNPPEEWNMDKQSQQQMEMLKTIPPSLQYYYREKINQYFYHIEGTPVQD